MTGNDLAANFIVNARWETLPDAVKQKIRMCLVDSVGAKRCRVSIPTEADGGPKHVVQRISEAVDLAIRAGQLQFRSTKHIVIGKQRYAQLTKDFVAALFAVPIETARIDPAVTGVGLGALVLEKL